MKLVVDANILVAELLRRRGRELFKNPQLELYFNTQIKDEAEYELSRRVKQIIAQRRLNEAAGQELIEAAFIIIRNQIQLVPFEFYGYLEMEAKKRISRDPNDWQIVALALSLPAAIWTEDYDFFGCGCPTWTTQNLMLQLF